MGLVVVAVESRSRNAAVGMEKAKQPTESKETAMIQATPEQMKEWVRQWQDTGDWLATVRVKEVAALTQEQALAQTRSLLELTSHWRSLPFSSGLEDQQALLQKLRAH